MSPFAGVWGKPCPRKPNPLARTPPSLLDLSPSAATNPRSISYDHVVTAPAPSDLPRQPPPLWLLRPPTLSPQFILHPFLLEVLIGPGREEAA